MEIHEPQIGQGPVQDLAHALKRTAHDVVHEHLAAQIDHADPLPVDPGDAHALAQLNRSQVDRPDQPVGFLNKHFQFTFGKRMVAHRNVVSSAAQQLIINLFGDAFAMGGILAVDDRQVRTDLFF